ncbi:BMP family lipoprotein [Sporanaerobium hydrogeniformans]|uniref:BMP family lipoprotein n=1 Tax=Sporanaerobium hydrogeniformans TaxID=3072179 RepID=UPI0026B6C902
MATALEQKTGEVGFLGGMKIPSVVRFQTGFMQGLQYANKTLGTSVNLDPTNSIYQGSFENVAAGQQIAAQMYDKGVQTIFCAAGDVGLGAITEAKSRAQAGSSVWIVGVDVDQYADGLYADNQSVILTSAVKKIDNAAYDMIKAELDHNFPGGQTLTFDVHNEGVGLPPNNPNLSNTTLEKVNEVYQKLQSGEITVSAE